MVVGIVKKLKKSLHIVTLFVYFVKLFLVCNASAYFYNRLKLEKVTFFSIYARLKS